MSSHQRRVHDRYQTRIRALALLVWLRRQALALLRRVRGWGVMQPILSDTDWCAAPFMPKSPAAMLATAVARIPEKTK